MTAFIVLLRAVNVGGTGKLPMSELKAICEAAGFAKVKTYIASGNVVFEGKASEAQVKAALEKRLLAYAGKPMRALGAHGGGNGRCRQKEPVSPRRPPTESSRFFSTLLRPPTRSPMRLRAQGRTDAARRTRNLR